MLTAAQCRIDSRSMQCDLRIVIAELAFVLCIVAVPTTAAPFAYVSNRDGYVSIIDTASNSRVSASIKVGSRPHGIAVSPDGERIYVVNSSHESVSVIDAKSQRIQNSIVLGGFPLGVAVSPDGTRVYVGDNSQSLNVLHVIDTATLRVVAAVPTGRGSHGIAVSPDGKRVRVEPSSRIAASAPFRRPGSVEVTRPTATGLLVRLTLQGDQPSRPMALALGRC